MEGASVPRTGRVPTLRSAVGRGSAPGTQIHQARNNPAKAYPRVLWSTDNALTSAQRGVSVLEGYLKSRHEPGAVQRQRD